MRVPQVAIYAGGGAPYHHMAVFAEAGYTVSMVFPVEVRGGELRSFDAFVVPGGGYEGMRAQIDALGDEGVDALAEFVASGGMYIGSCAGAYDAATPAEAFRQICPAQRRMSFSRARVWNETADPWSDLLSPGIGRLRVVTQAPQHPIMVGIPAEFEIVHYNGPLFVGGESLFAVGGPTPNFTPSEGFLSEQWSRPTMVERAATERVSAAVVDRFEKGRVVLFGGHPEFGFSLAMDDRQLPARLLTNAIEWQLEEGNAPVRERGRLLSDSPRAPLDIAGRLANAALRIRSELKTLRDHRSLAPWLERKYAMSVFGIEPGAVWSASLVRLEELLDEVQERAGTVRPNLLGFAQPEYSELDFGYHGVVALLEQAGTLLREATDRWGDELGAVSDDPYAFAKTSPYQLVSGSYLSALGRVAAAALLCRHSGADVNRRGS